MIAKPSRLSYDVRRWSAKQAKTAASLKDRKANAKAWRVISQAVKARDLGLCRICHEPTLTIGHPAKLGAAHHIVWRSAGGGDDLQNLV